MELDRDKSIYNPPMTISANIFRKQAYTDKTWTEGTATQGCNRSAGQGPGFRRARTIPDRSPEPGILAESDNSCRSFRLPKAAVKTTLVSLDYLSSIRTTYWFVVPTFFVS